MSIAIDLRIIAKKLEKDSEDVLVQAYTKGKEYFEKISECVAGASLILEKTAEHIEQNHPVAFSEQDLDELAALATSFYESGDPLLLKKADLLDEVLQKIAAEPLIDTSKYRSQDMENYYKGPKAALDKMNLVPETRQALKQQIRRFRPLEAPLSTRYSPDQPSMLIRISDGVYQDEMTGKIFDYKSGYTTAKGNEIPGQSVELQTSFTGDEKMSTPSPFETRESMISARYSSIKDEVIALRAVRDYHPELIKEAMDHAAEAGLNADEVADALVGDVEPKYAQTLLEFCAQSIQKKKINEPLNTLKKEAGLVIDDAIADNFVKLGDYYIVSVKFVYPISRMRNNEKRDVVIRKNVEYFSEIQFESNLSLITDKTTRNVFAQYSPTEGWGIDREKEIVDGKSPAYIEIFDKNNKLVLKEGIEIKNSSEYKTKVPFNKPQFNKSEESQEKLETIKNEVESFTHRHFPEDPETAQENADVIMDVIESAASDVFTPMLGAKLEGEELSKTPGFNKYVPANPETGDPESSAFVPMQFPFMTSTTPLTPKSEPFSNKGTGVNKEGGSIVDVILSQIRNDVAPNIIHQIIDFHGKTSWFEDGPKYEQTFAECKKVISGREKSSSLSIEERRKVDALMFEMGFVPPYTKVPAKRRSLEVGTTAYDISRHKVPKQKLEDLKTQHTHKEEYEALEKQGDTAYLVAKEEARVNRKNMPQYDKFMMNYMFEHGFKYDSSLPEHLIPKPKPKKISYSYDPKAFTEAYLGAKSFATHQIEETKRQNPGISNKTLNKEFIPLVKEFMENRGFADPYREDDDPVSLERIIPADFIDTGEVKSEEIAKLNPIKPFSENLSDVEKEQTSKPDKLPEEIFEEKMAKIEAVFQPSIQQILAQEKNMHVIRNYDVSRPLSKVVLISTDKVQQLLDDGDIVVLIEKNGKPEYFEPLDLNKTIPAPFVVFAKIPNEEIFKDTLEKIKKQNPSAQFFKAFDHDQNQRDIRTILMDKYSAEDVLKMYSQNKLWYISRTANLNMNSPKLVRLNVVINPTTHTETLGPSFLPQNSVLIISDKPVKI